MVAHQGRGRADPLPEPVTWRGSWRGAEWLPLPHRGLRRPPPVNGREQRPYRLVSTPVVPLYAGGKLWTVLPAAAIVQQHVATFQDFPPRQAPPGFNPQTMVETVLQTAAQRQGN